MPPHGHAVRIRGVWRSARGGSRRRREICLLGVLWQSAAQICAVAAARALQIRSLGVSNYAVEDFEELMQSATVPPAINQIEINPFLYRKNTIKVA